MAATPSTALPPAEEQPGTDFVLDAIEQLLDAMEHLNAPLTRELLGCAMMALVHECHLTGKSQLN